MLGKTVFDLGHLNCEVLGVSPQGRRGWMVEHRRVECGGRDRSPTWRRMTGTPPNLP